MEARNSALFGIGAGLNMQSQENIVNSLKFKRSFINHEKRIIVSAENLRKELFTDLVRIQNWNHDQLTILNNE